MHLVARMRLARGHPARMLGVFFLSLRRGGACLGAQPPSLRSLSPAPSTGSWLTQCCLAWLSIFSHGTRAILFYLCFVHGRLIFSAHSVYCCPITIFPNSQRNANSKTDSSGFAFFFFRAQAPASVSRRTSWKAVSLHAYMPAGVP